MKLILICFTFFFCPFDAAGNSYRPYLQSSLSFHFSWWTGISIVLLAIILSKILCNYRLFTKFYCFLNLMFFSLWRWLPLTVLDYCHWSWRWNPKILECIPFAEITGNYLLKYKGKSLLFSFSAPLAYIIDHGLNIWLSFISNCIAISLNVNADAGIQLNAGSRNVLRGGLEFFFLDPL